MTECVNKMKNGARGSDLVPLNVVKAILSFILPMLVEIANGFFNDETFPDIFKRARIVPLHRNGDKDVAVISNRYRLYLHFPEFLKNVSMFTAYNACPPALSFFCRHWSFSYLIF